MDYYKSYHSPASLDEAVRLLAHYNGSARVIAGGTDLLIDLQHQGHSEQLEALVDITRIEELNTLSFTSKKCYVGATVTHSRLARSCELEQKATCLVESCGVIGGPQIRNVATLGGNVIHALPAGDGTVSLITLNASVEVAWHDGQREWLNIQDVYAGPGISAIDSTKDVLVQFAFNLCGKRQGTAFKRIMRPQGVALPVLGCAVWVQLDETARVYDDIRICIAPVAPTPIRAKDVENALRGQSISETSLESAIQIAMDSLEPRTSKYRATSEYRREMIASLLKRVIPLAVHRACTDQSTAQGIGLE